MPLGWIDYSKSERSKVLSVLDMLSESGTLDELGISPIRDGFSNIFFPGTSTIQTRAKYFLIVPYALKDLELSSESNPNKILKAFDDIERQCGEKLLSAGTDTEGVIGNRSLKQGKWVKRTPADIYWAGIRNYGIFTKGNFSITEYVRATCAMKNQKATLSKLGNRNDNVDVDADDKDAGDLIRMQFWKLPTYRTDWIDELEIKLSEEEASFLKHQIIQSYPDSMLAYILRNGMTDIFQCEEFYEMESIVHVFPEQMQSDFKMAMDFSGFLYVLRTMYNIMISEGKNSLANQEWSKIEPLIGRLSAVDFESIFTRLQLHRNVSLWRFLVTEQQLMRDGDVEGIKNEIRRRERELKQNRAKTMHPGEFDTDVWYGGGFLDYRFNDAKVIIRDIFESEGLYVKPEQ